MCSVGGRFFITGFSSHISKARWGRLGFAVQAEAPLARFCFVRFLWSLTLGVRATWPSTTSQVRDVGHPWFSPIRFQPELVAAPGGYGADVADVAGTQFFFEVRDGEADDLHVGFFVVALVRAGGEFFGDVDVLALAGEAVCDPHPGELGHAAGDETGFFAQFAARELFGVVDLRFPAALRQFERALADGVAELLDQPDVIAVDGEDGGAVVLVDDAVDAAGAVGALDCVFANAEPVVAIDLAGGERADSHELRMAGLAVRGTCASGQLCRWRTPHFAGSRVDMCGWTVLACRCLFRVACNGSKYRPIEVLCGTQFFLLREWRCKKKGKEGTCEQD